MKTAEAIRVASEHLRKLAGHEFDVIDVGKPRSIDEAVNLSRIISKLSPILGNLIEFNAVGFLNENPKFSALGKWVRQDPDFPDALFVGEIDPAPGFEVKAWFPLATEITARFKDSQNTFADNATHVILLAWLPKFLVYGKPYILDVEVVSGLSIAKARDDHYHNPPDYLVLEPEDTESRTRNLQQTNTNGYKFQGSPADFAKAQKIVEGWARWRQLQTDSPVSSAASPTHGDIQLPPRHELCKDRPDCPSRNREVQGLSAGDVRSRKNHLRLVSHPEQRERNRSSRCHGHWAWNKSRLGDVCSDDS